MTDDQWERLQELLVDELERPLSPRESEEKERLLAALREAPPQDASEDDVELAAATLQLCWMPDGWEAKAEREMSPGLQGSLEAAANRYFEQQAPAASHGARVPDSRPASRPAERSAGSTGQGGAVESALAPTAVTWGGWLAAAACLGIALWSLRGRDEVPGVGRAGGPNANVAPIDCARLCPPGAAGDAPADEETAPGQPSEAQPGQPATEAPADEPTNLAEHRQNLLEHEATVQWAWTNTGDALSGDVRGDVVWNAQEQRGYLHFAGLPENQPTQAQYQLWIFDAARNEAHPVDGGVFDVSGEAIVPIDPRVPIHEATLFAVTLERPGGVVVSTRERLVALAKPG